MDLCINFCILQGKGGGEIFTEPKLLMGSFSRYNCEKGIERGKGATFFYLKCRTHDNISRLSNDTLA